MYELSSKAGELADELAGALDLLRHVLASMDELDNPVEREALANGTQSACERFSQLAARRRREVIRGMRDDGMLLADIASAIGVSRPRVSEMLR